LETASVVTDKWRAIWHVNKQSFELYDRARDPQEQIDVALRFPEVVEELTGVMRSRRRGRK
jgi:hypothetical protein